MRSSLVLCRKVRRDAPYVAGWQRGQPKSCGRTDCRSNIARLTGTVALPEHFIRELLRTSSWRNKY
ncbi:hypothetical protein Mal52_57570 [Symmachiella dynata]|uniref:Uncharacterized protein n=1 Tax=Symmachiella dynata TaxID=2527995 RepID=A0A517ZXM6_9PLAN|nr:hypothetical protein Mal52_57570 [Symmachiella dynata]